MILVYGFFGLLCLVLPALILAWAEWNYSTTWSTSIDQETVDGVKKGWFNVWGEDSPGKTHIAPRPRRGHSMVTTEYEDNTYILLFGGRGNDFKKRHVPKTYNIEKVNGTIIFTTYDNKSVNPCDDNGQYYSESQRSGCDVNHTSMIDVGSFYNDVWAYKLCDEFADSPERVFAHPCINNGWELWHPGGLEGGCNIELGILVSIFAALMLCIFITLCEYALHYVCILCMSSTCKLYVYYLITCTLPHFPPVMICYAATSLL